jgi:L-threonylcarbamoyladenylate synthase
METKLLATDSPESFAAAVEAASHALAAGETVALPTETVYGLAADALNVDAVAKIFEAKERPYFDPLIVHLPDREWLERVAAIPEESRSLVEALIAKFWPGPLTLVLPRRDIVPDLVTAGLETVAVRMSAHPVFQAVLARFGRPLAAPSANRFGRISPTAAEHVRTELGGRISLIVDGGPTQHGLESTIVALDGTRLRMLRAGPVTAEEDLGGVWAAWRLSQQPPPEEAEVTEMFAQLGVSFPKMMEGRPTAIEAPGQLKSHYAPRTPLRLQYPGVHFRFHRRGEEPIPRVGSLAFQEPSRAGQFACEEILSPSGDLREAAATLFAKLRRLDEAGLDLILAETVPERGLGIAIMDRLRKAAAEHE